MTLHEANDLVLNRISEADGPITLGLLPMEADEQHQIIELVVAEAQGDAARLIRMLRFRYVAAVTYALSAAASEAITQGGKFWGPFSGRLKVPLDNPALRQDLSHTFVSVCRQLGVVDPDVSDMNWSVAAPLMAQASILHCWAENLVHGMQTTLKRRPLPDLEASFSLAYFAGDIAEHIHGQANLHDILRTEVGGIVALRLIKSCLFGQFELLPHHLREPMRTAFAGTGRQAALKAPYVTFSVVDGGFALVLPKQPPRLVSERSHWLINGAQYSARTDVTLSEHEVGAQGLEVKLRHLRNEYGDQSFRVSLALEQPCRVFDAGPGRERSIQPGRENALPPGEYRVVMRSDARSDEADAEQVTGHYRLLDGLEIRPGIEPLRIESAGLFTTLAPALKAGLFLAAGSEGNVMLEDGSRLHYGDTFPILACIPRDQHSGEASVEVRVNDELVLSAELPMAGEGSGVHDYSLGVQSVLRDALGGLKPGIHAVKIRVFTATISTSRSIWFWQGLQSIGRYSGFRCNEAASNLNLQACRGIRKSGSGYEVDPNYHAPRIVLALQNETRLALMRPGIHAVCLDPREGEELTLRAGEMLTVTDRDTRLLAFESGGFESWSIECNGAALVALDRRRTTFQIGLRSLVAQCGKTGLISAIGQAGERFPLVRFASQLIGKRLWMDIDHQREVHCWKTSVPTADLGRMAVRLSDYSIKPQPEVGEHLVIYTSEDPRTEPTVEQAVADGVTLFSTLAPAEGTKPERLKLNLEVDLKSISTRLLLIDFLHGAAEANEWTPLYCADGPNVSRLTITANGDAVTDAVGMTWWRHLWRTSSRYHTQEANLLYQALTESEVAAALREIGILTALKYPSAVYHESARYLSSLAHRLSTRRNEVGQRDNDAWWTEGVVELAQHSAERVTPVVRQFLFSCNPQCLRRSWRTVLADAAHAEDWLVSALRIDRDVTAEGGRVPYAIRHFNASRHPPELFGSFANFALVVSGQAADFVQFDFQKFFRPIFARAEGHEESASSLDGGPLLSARHLRQAVLALNRRALVLEKASTGDAEHPLRSALQTLATALQATANMMTPLHQKIGFVPWVRSVNGDGYNHDSATSAPPLPLLAGEQAERLHHLTWRFCVLARGTAHGRIAKDTFVAAQKQFSGDRVQAHPLNLILSFAPELFAYYCGLLDFALYSPAASES